MLVNHGGSSETSTRLNTSPREMLMLKMKHNCRTCNNLYNNFALCKRNSAVHMLCAPMVNWRLLMLAGGSTKFLCENIIIDCNNTFGIWVIEYSKRFFTHTDESQSWRSSKLLIVFFSVWHCSWQRSWHFWNNWEPWMHKKNYFFVIQWNGTKESGLGHFFRNY